MTLFLPPLLGLGRSPGCRQWAEYIRHPRGEVRRFAFDQSSHPYPLYLARPSPAALTVARGIQEEADVVAVAGVGEPRRRGGAGGSARRRWRRRGARRHCVQALQRDLGRGGEGRGVGGKEKGEKKEGKRKKQTRF